MSLQPVTGLPSKPLLQAQVRPVASPAAAGRSVHAALAPHAFVAHASMSVQPKVRSPGSPSKPNAHAQVRPVVSPSAGAGRSLQFVFAPHTFSTHASMSVQPVSALPS